MGNINYVAAVVASIVTYLLSAVWYLVLFRKPFVEGLGKTAAEMAKGPTGLQASIMQVIGNFILIVILAMVMEKFKVHSLVDALKLAGLLWLGFVAAVLAPMYAFEAYSLSFFGITAGSVLLTMLVASAIMVMWK